MPSKWPSCRSIALNLTYYCVALILMSMAIAGLTLTMNGQFRGNKGEFSAAFLMVIFGTFFLIVVDLIAEICIRFDLYAEDSLFKCIFLDDDDESNSVVVCTTSAALLAFMSLYFQAMLGSALKSAENVAYSGIVVEYGGANMVAVICWTYIFFFEVAIIAAFATMLGLAMKEYIKSKKGDDVTGTNNTIELTPMDPAASDAETAGVEPVESMPNSSIVDSAV